MPAWRTSQRTLGRISGTLKCTLVGTVAAATLVGASTGPANAGTEQPEEPGYQQPTVGECRKLSFSEGLMPTNNTTPVDCANPPLDSVARCLTAGLSTTTCDRAHAFRATGAFTLHPSHYPGDDEFAEAAVKRCPELVEGRNFRWTDRSRYAWNLGNHTVVSFTKTHG